ncbi:MAG: putative zinc-binding protein, partial [Chloroflexi bacterium]|nr:putative zinc-binding protein [Chloroflexota bacterium]
MPNLPKKKVGLIACGGEELAAGTLSRVAIRLVLETLRPDDTVTLCLPLFLAGEQEERAFARFYPTIAVDGCGKDCAARATARFSAPVAAALRVDELLAEAGVTVNPAWRRELDAAGWAAAERLAQVIAARVDALLGPRPTVEATGSPIAEAPASATCACATQIPVSRIQVAGEEMELLAL